MVLASSIPSIGTWLIMSWQNQAMNCQRPRGTTSLSFLAITLVVDDLKSLVGCLFLLLSHQLTQLALQGP
jgi:hypothetical protein